jgi:HSP20 family protein
MTMLTLKTYRPARVADVNRAFDPLDRVFDLREWAALRPYRLEAFVLPVDVVATEDEFVLTAVVPGLKAEDLSVEILGDTVTLRGDVRAPDYGKDARALLQERVYGEFARRLTLPVELDGAKAEALVENGVLTLRLPKAEAAKPKQIKVTVK